jgi:hypothetical protein
MQALLDHLLGVVRPVDPRLWAQAIRKMRTAEGWVPPMVLLAAFAMLFFIGQGFGLLGGNIVLKIFNYFAIATWIVVCLLGNMSITIDGLNNLRRLGFFGIRNPRWSFEVSRLAWMTLLFVALTGILFEILGGAKLKPVGDALFYVVPALYVTFFVSGTMGYALSAITGRRRRGRAFECVQYFYWMFGIIGALFSFAIWLPARAGWGEPLVVVACIVGAALLAPLVIAITKPERRRHDFGEVAQPQEFPFDSPA